LARVLGVGGVGRNYFMMTLDDLESLPAGRVAVRKMFVSCDSTDVGLSFSQRIKLRFFKPFLKSSRHFADEQRVPDDAESVVARGRQWDIGVLEDHLGSTFQETSENLVADAV
jgi:hypothetical protein